MEISRVNLRPDTTAKEQVISLAVAKYNISRDQAVTLVEDAYRHLDKNEPADIRFNLTAANGDTAPTSTTIVNYLDKISNQDVAITPSWSTYRRDPKILAPEPEIVATKMKERDQQKKAAFKARMAKNMQEFELQFTMQVGSKTVSNALSGAVSVGGTCLQNPSSHSSSTSGARIATSTTNQAIDRFISGNMHFKNPDVVYGYIGSILETLRDEKIAQAYQDVMDTYTLNYPSVDDVLAMIKSNTKDYWIDENYTPKYRKILMGMRPLSLAVLYYNGSLFYLHKGNPALIERWLSEMSTRKTKVPEETDVENYKALDDIYKEYVSHLFYADLKGVIIGYEEYDKQLLADMLATADGFKEDIAKMDSLIKLFFEPLIQSPCVGDYKEAIRDSIPVNDTDSGFFTISIWVEILWGSPSLINDKTIALCGVFLYLTNIVYRHVLMQVSLNMNVRDPEERYIEMKTEVTLSMLALPNASKHYFADEIIVEGNVLPESNLIQKGVGFRNASTPAIIRTIAKDIEMDIAESLKHDGHIDIYKYMDIMVAAEKILIEGSKNGADYYRTQDIKSHDSTYYLWADFWNNTKLGSDNKVDIPCTLIKLSTTLTSKTKLKAWIETIEDPHLKQDIEQWCIDNKRTVLPRIYLPKEKVLSNGMPDCFKEILDYRPLVLDICNMFYMILETAGVRKPTNVMLCEFYDPAYKLV